MNMKTSLKKYQKMFISKQGLKLLCIILFFQICLIPLPGETANNNDDKEKDKMSLDLLIAPSSPALALLGNESASIIRPETGTDLAFTILKKTENLSAVPNDFAIEFLPAWVIGGKNITFDSLKDNKNPLRNLWQTMSISIAAKSNSNDKKSSSVDGNSSVSSNSENDPWSLSLGMRFSLLRGTLLYEEEYTKIVQELNRKITKNIDTDNYRKKLREELKKYTEGTNEWEEINEKIIKRTDEIEAETIKSEKKNTLRAASEAALETNNFKRVGLNLNIAGGVVWNFPGSKFENGKLDRWGLWATFSYAMKKVNLLAVGRYLSMEEDEDSIKKHCFDFGGRIIFDSFKKYSLSGELLYRKYNRNENETDTSQWRAALLFEYQIGKNQTIHISVGRDFEGNENGNLISMIGLKLGLGSGRPFISKKFIDE